MRTPWALMLPWHGLVGGACAAVDAATSISKILSRALAANGIDGGAALADVGFVGQRLAGRRHQQVDGTSFGEGRGEGDGQAEPVLAYGPS
jgi:hypothetical protein